MRVWEGLTDSPSWWDLLTSLHGKLMFDVGANVGQAARLFSRSFSQVISFEPCEEAYEHLLAGHAPNVMPLRYAVSDHDGTVDLAVCAKSIESGQLTSGVCAEEAMGWGDVVGWRTVACTTIDRQVRCWGLPDHIKIDTEGHELAVLAGAAWLISRRETAWYVEMHSRANEAPARELFDGYQVTIVDHDYAPAPFDNYYLKAVPA